MILGVLLFFVLLCPVFFSSAKPPAEPAPAADRNLHLRVQPFAGEDTYTRIYESPGRDEASYVLFLPADCDRQHLRVTFSEDWVRVDGNALDSGAATSAFAKDGEVSVQTPGGTFPVTVMSSANLPSLFLTTESGSLDAIHADRDHFEKGRLSAAEEGKLVLDSAPLAKIKGRGNSSWVYNDKKGYNIKFEHKTGLFGMKKAKKWALIPNNMDDTLLRNALAYTAAKRTRLPYTVSFAFVDLYLNGEYRGNYFLCEKVEVGKNRVAVADLDNLNEQANPGWKNDDAEKRYGEKNGTQLAWSGPENDPENISGGYLLEYDLPEVYEQEPSAFITKNKTSLNLRSPQYATENEISYVASLYEEFERALLSKNGKNEQGRHYTDYIDMDSFIDGLLLKECTGNSDIGHTSWFIFLPEDTERFYMAPIWDFDLSMENAGQQPDSIRFFANAEFQRKYHLNKTREKTFFELLCAHRDFMDALAERYFALGEDLFRCFDETAETLSQQIRASAAMNAVRWDFSSGPKDASSLTEYLSARKAKLDEDFAQIDARVAETVKELENTDDPDVAKAKTTTVLFCCAGAGVLFVAAIFTAGAVSYRRKRKQKAEAKKQNGKKKKQKSKRR